MRRLPVDRFVLAVAAVVAAVPLTAASASAAFVTSVVENGYTQGWVTFANPESKYDDPVAALDAPNRIAGASVGFAGPVTPFNPPFEESEVVALGLEGSLTLELPAAMAVRRGALQVGIFTTAGINDPTYSGQAESPARTFAGTEFGADRTAVVEVASDLGDFKSLGRVVFANPTQGYANQSTPYDFPEEPVPSDFDKPFGGTLSSFDGLTSDEISTLLAGSAGGTWLSVPASVELDEVRYVRISDPKWLVLADGTFVDERDSAYDPVYTKTADVFIDGVNVAVPEPAGLGLLAVSSLLLLRRGRRA